MPQMPSSLLQMASIPEDGVSLQDESALEDQANPDKRNPHQVCIYRNIRCS
jgi:hypothetical protein